MGLKSTLELDQIMRQNELTMALVAAFPAILITGYLLMAGVRVLRPPPPDSATEAVPCRLG